MQLLPEWRSEYPGMKVPAGADDFRLLTRKAPSGRYPTSLVQLLPHAMTYSTPFNNHGNFIVSLGQLTPWLAQKAESLGVDVFPGFAAAEALFDEARRRQGRAHRRHGPGEGRRARPQLHRRPGNPRAAHGHSPKAAAARSRNS